ncbi:hypothetical protein PTTG_03361 [Puccinia triticina 1-1 BBBD Race 1]|uniref:Uncharacterized protein n=2 Tax=Puccinia triticina TaxID=208348 RepID=A0A180GNU4_PUCT1|nr:uncharacterized protein PtA15_13A213 [Puccinia triticina]OAV94390.1 hypothetical protein PTTG_03361 [Puccinia triticina 1-1 BBBD Race 1]WAQ90814.1 hypothetical protein PtA15_13A213 [Puccinia triticina]WAR61000.1 hypothetical protein PtB15_13B251 [Puccinia triticina]
MRTMADAQDGAMSGVINSFEALQSDDQKEQILNYEGLVRKEMTRIHDEYLSIWDGINYGKEPRVIFDELAIRTQLLAKLQSKSLPSLRRHANGLSKALLLCRSDPPLDNQPEPAVYKMKLVLKALSKLDSTLRDIKFAIACISPDLDIEKMRDDKDFKQLKFFRSYRLAVRTYAVTGIVCELLRISCGHVKESGHMFNEDPSKRLGVETMATACSESVNQTLIYMSKSEVNIFQDAWELDIESMSDSLEKFVKFMHQSQSELKEEEEEYSHSLAGRGPPGAHSARPANNASQPPIPTDPQLSHTTIFVISIIKLSRMLVAKILKISTGKENLTMVSDLSSRELELLVRTTEALSDSIVKLVGALSDDDPDHQFDALMTIKRSISHLLSAPRVILELLQHIFRPVDPDQLSSKIHLKAWFNQWNILYHLATRNFVGDLGFPIP